MQSKEGPLADGPTTSGGIAGCARQRLLTEMLDGVTGTFKVLLCDEMGAGILNDCFRMHELVEHGVTLLEDIHRTRQTIINCPALYFISPNERSLQAAMDDWEEKDAYQETHLFFTGVAPPSLLEILSRSRLGTKLRTLKDLMLEFSAPEPLAFHLGMQHELPKLFPVERALMTGRHQLFPTMVEQLVSVFRALADGPPTIRYQRGSQLAPIIAAHFAERLASMEKNISDFWPSPRRHEQPLLIIVDRSFDCVAPLVHDRTYQCLLQDLHPLEHGVYQHTVTTRAGESIQREVSLDRFDPYWCAYRHVFFSTCMVDFDAALKALMESNPALISSGGQKGGLDVHDVGNAIRALPEFQEKQEKLSTHIGIVEKVFGIYQAQRLADVCEVEQHAAARRTSWSSAYRTAARYTADGSIPLPVRQRLACLFLAAAACTSDELSEEKRAQLLQSCQMDDETPVVRGLRLLLQQRSTGDSLFSDPGGRDGLSTPPIDVHGGIRSNTLAAEGSAAAPGGAPSDPFRGNAAAILEGAVTGTLSLVDFPLLEGEGGGGATPQRDDGPSFRRQIFRSDAGSSSDGIGSMHVNPAAGGRSGVLDLGYEGTVELVDTQRVVLFVLGGATFGEMRAAYEVSRAHGREVMVGGTSALRPDDFVAQLGAIVYT